MINIAEAYINEKKEMIKYSDNENFNFYEEKQIDKYKIESKIKKNELYYQCYELNVKVSLNNNIVEVNTYVAKE